MSTGYWLRDPALDDLCHRPRMHFETLTRDQQATVVRRLAAEGFSEHIIAAASGLSVEMVRRVLGGIETRRG